MTRCFNILFLFLPGLVLQAQEPERDKFPFLSFSPHVGYIIPHSDDLKGISNSTPFGFQAEAGFVQTGPKAYSQTLSFSRLGLALQHMQFGNPKELGSSTALTAFLEPYILAESRVQLSFRFGIGATYLNKVYNAQTNPRNVFFSSPISFVTFLAFTGRVSLSPNWKATGSLFYNHISNGGAKMPNKGINFPTLSLGLDYLPFGEKFSKPNLEKQSQNEWSIYLESGFSGKNTPEGRTKPSKMALIANALALAEKKVNPIHGFSLGFEFTEDQYQKAEFDYWKLRLSHQTLGLMMGHAFHLGKVRLTQHYGIYLYNEEPGKRFAYQRYGLYYQCSRRFYFGGTLKVHRHVADIFDIRLGWRIRP